MTFRQVILSINGLRERDLMWQGIARRMTYLILSGVRSTKEAKKIIKGDWPMEGDGKTGGGMERAMETLRKMKEAELINIANKEVHARRIKNTGRGGRKTSE